MRNRLNLKECLPLDPMYDRKEIVNPLEALDIKFNLLNEPVNGK